MFQVLWVIQLGIVYGRVGSVGRIFIGCSVIVGIMMSDYLVCCLFCWDYYSKMVAFIKT